MAGRFIFLLIDVIYIYECYSHTMSGGGPMQAEVAKPVVEKKPPPPVEKKEAPVSKIR